MLFESCATPMFSLVFNTGKWREVELTIFEFLRQSYRRDILPSGVVQIIEIWQSFA